MSQRCCALPYNPVHILHAHRHPVGHTHIRVDGEHTHIMSHAIGKGCGKRQTTGAVIATPEQARQAMLDKGLSLSLSLSLSLCVCVCVSLSLFLSLSLSRKHTHTRTHTHTHTHTLTHTRVRAHIQGKGPFGTRTSSDARAPLRCHSRISGRSFFGTGLLPIFLGASNENTACTKTKRYGQLCALCVAVCLLSYFFCV